VDHGYQLVII